MKPISTNNLSAWGYVGLFILFSLPYVGNLALIICAFFVKDHAVKSFARALLILSLISIVFLVVAALLGIVNHKFFTESIDKVLGTAGNHNFVWILACKAHSVTYHITPQTARC